MKKLRQGQTIYLIERGYMYSPPRPSILKIFLYSRKQDLPPEACIIEKWPVNYVEAMISKLGCKDIYFSRSKAQKALRQYNLALNGRLEHK